MKKLIFRVHARQRMIERRIDDGAVRRVLERGETIASDEDDAPYPSRLVLGMLGRGRSTSSSPRTARTTS
jgi:hypothetical protein